MVAHSVRHWVSFLVGAIIFVLGLFPLIGHDEWLGPLTTTVLGAVAMYLVAFGGLYVIIDSFFEYTFHSGIFITSFVIGLLVFGFGLTTILKSMGAITFGLSGLSLVVYEIVFMLEGLFLMFACFVMD
jgi:hypothetical protein